MVDFADFTQIEFINSLASSDPTPGGGSAAAIALSQSAGLTVMVADITLGREKWKDGWGCAQIAKNIAKPLLCQGIELANKDTNAFEQVMASFKLPKNTDDESLIRKQAITDSTYLASTVPLETAKLALKLLMSQIDLAKLGNSNAVTDVGVASLLSSAACKGALLNVQINANSLPDELSSDLIREINDLRTQAGEASRAVMKAVYDRMAD